MTKDIYFMGYMSSGKSTIGRLLAQKLDCNFIDFDTYLELAEGRSISAIFSQNGELYFRKKETLYLKQLLDQNTAKRNIIALGGGTPCYGSNLQLLQQALVHTIYLSLSATQLTQRLWLEKESRPLVAQQQSYEALEEFVRKHVFERGYFYNQADTILKVQEQTPQETIDELLQLL